MKCFLLAALAAFPALALADNDAAYKALKVFGKKYGDGSLNRVVEVRGRSGVPQPAVWKVVSLDPGARGGVVEAEVQRGKIISERTPTNRSGGAIPMNFNQLNLDSDGAFTIADQEMQKHNLPFDHVDYVLRSSGASTPPVWFLELFDGPNGRIASLELAADTGAVLNSQFGKAPDYSQDRTYLNNNGNPGPGQGPVAGRGYSRPGEPFHDVGDFFHRLGKRFERRGEEMKNFFTGENKEPRN
jgi:hypothetical protein